MTRTLTWYSIFVWTWSGYGSGSANGSGSQRANVGAARNVGDDGAAP